MNLSVDETLLNSAADAFSNQQKINAKKIELLSKIFIKMVEKYPKLEPALKEELDELRILMRIEN